MEQRLSYSSGYDDTAFRTHPSYSNRHNSARSSCVTRGGVVPSGVVTWWASSLRLGQHAPVVCTLGPASNLSRRTNPAGDANPPSRDHRGLASTKTRWGCNPTRADLLWAMPFASRAVSMPARRPTSTDTRPTPVIQDAPYGDGSSGWGEARRAEPQEDGKMAKTRRTQHEEGPSTSEQVPQRPAPTSRTRADHPPHGIYLC